MDEDGIKKAKEAGKIISEVREESRKFVKIGSSLSQIADTIENMLIEKGAAPAFPACLSINNMAAHYAPGKDDKSVVPEGALIKVDIGAHVDGFIADTAYTIAFRKEDQPLADASTAALLAAIEQCYTGNTLSNVSAAIESTIKDFGFTPVSNLTGHGLGHYWLHDEPSVPNVKTNSTYKLKENQLIAIEPFATSGIGRVNDADSTTIFRIAQAKPVRNPEARRIMEFAFSVNGLPFAERWIPLDSLFKIRLAMRELREKEILYEYPALKEASGALVSQTEHSILVGDKPLVTTR